MSKITNDGLTRIPRLAQLCPYGSSWRQTVKKVV